MRTEQHLLIGLFVVMIILSFAQVVFRYLLKFSAPWTEELARYSMVWMVMIGTALAIDTDGHIRLDILGVIVKNRKVLDFLDLGIVAALALFAVYFVWSGLSYMAQLQAMGERAIATGMPMTIPQSSIVIGAALLLLHLVRRFVQLVWRLGRNKSCTI